MNLKQPYEHLIAGKLRQLRAPDANASWQQMKRLLDDDEDTRGGGRKRPPGNGLWRIGILAIVLSASFWLYHENSPTPALLSKNNVAASPQPGNQAAGTNNSNPSNKTKTTAIDNTTTLSGSGASNNASDNKVNSNGAAINATAVTAIKNNTGLAAPGSAAATAVNPAATAENNTAKKTAPALNDNLVKTGHGITTGVNNNSISSGTHDDLSGAATSGKNKLNNHGYISGNHTTDAARNVSAEAGNAAVEDMATTTEQNQRIKKPSQHGGKGSNMNAYDNTMDPVYKNGNKTAGINYSPVNQPAFSRQQTFSERLVGLTPAGAPSSFNTSLVTADSIKNSQDISNLLNNETKKGIAKAKRDNEIALLDKKDKKSLHLNLSNLFKPFSMHADAEPWWAAGIALNAAITVNTQNHYNHNMNAKSSTLSDYIPSPYLQFHLNNYVYFQTELNFVSPQYTPQLLVYRQSNDISAQLAGTSQQKSIYIQKMYYFNWPVSLHYSPISNLYFSAGLQFSSFQSGLASIEEKQYATASGPDHASSVSNTILKFKDDSIAAKVSPNEWRWQAGAEYYWNRFSVGLRYNQSFKKAINTTVLPGLPPTVNRNESLLFFVRYNLFESRAKNTVPKNQ